MLCQPIQGAIGWVVGRLIATAREPAFVDRCIAGAKAVAGDNERSDACAGHAAAGIVPFADLIAEGAVGMLHAGLGPIMEGLLPGAVADLCACPLGFVQAKD